MHGLLDSVLVKYPATGAAVSAALEVLQSKAARSALRYGEHVVVAVFLASLGRTYYHDGFQGLAKLTLQGLRMMPGMNSLIAWALSREASANATEMRNEQARDGHSDEHVRMTEVGMPREELLQLIRDAKARDSHDERGKLFGYVYTQNDEAFEVTKLAFKMFADEPSLSPAHAEAKSITDEAYTIFQHTNALNPQAYPSLLKFETEAIALLADLLHGPTAVGSLTTGVHENAMLVVKTYRDRARATRGPWARLTMVAPASIHPCYAAAAAALDVELIRVPLGDSFVVQPKALMAAVDSHTIAILLSCPQPVHGVIDLVEETALLAASRGLPVHVNYAWNSLFDGSPPCDFALPAVHSISLSLPAMGVLRSVAAVLFRDLALRKHQIYAYSHWPGGLFASPTLLGTRAGGPIAATWALLRSQGIASLQAMTVASQAEARKLQQRLAAIPELAVPTSNSGDMFIVCAKGNLDLSAVADLLEAQGFHFARLQAPLGLSIELSASLVAAADEVVAAFEEAVAQVQAQGGTIPGPGTMQRMLASQEDRTRVASFIVETVCASMDGADAKR